MSGNMKIAVGLMVVAAIGVGVFIAYKKKPEWFSGIMSNPNQGSPAVGAAPTVDRTSERIRAGSDALSSVSSAYHSILG